MDKETCALEMKHIIKRFSSFPAVNDISIQVHKGEVHAICGENGAGKSTLMRVLAGEYPDYEGQIFIDGKEVKIDSPTKARKCGIAIIHQELGLARPITVAENIMSGALPKKRWIFLDKKKLWETSAKYLEMVGLKDLNPDMPVSALSQHEAQLVEIAKALSNHPGILIMDEPTSSLSREESRQLFEIIHELTSQGLAVLYISHFMSEVFEISDVITTMRDGKHIETIDKTKTTTKEVIRNMVGKDIQDFYTKQKTDVGAVVLEAKKLARYGFFKDISFQVHEGEILGICGLSGAGRSELARALVGIDQWDTGELYYEGQALKNRSYTQAIRKNIAYLSEDRKLEGLLLNLSIGENITSAKTISQSRSFWCREGEEKEQVDTLMEKLQVNPRNVNKIVGQLSGGNQQKVLLAKWLLTNPKLLILDEPTRGVDVGAKSMIHEAVKRHVSRGNAAILISSDLMEVGGLSDRILILYQGRQKGIIDKEQDNCSEVSLLMLANGDGKAYEEA